MTGHQILGVPDSPEQREFLGRRFADCALLASVLLILLGVVPHLAGDPHADDVQLWVLVGIGVTCWPLSRYAIRLQLRFGPPMWRVVLAGGCVLAFVLPTATGASFAGIASMAPVFISGGSHTFHGPRVAWTWSAAVLAAFAFGMAVVGGPDSLGATLVGVGAAIVFGEGLKRVFERLVAATVAERAARAAADEARARLAEASARKSAFLARVSHELRTPLNAVLGFSGLIHERVAGPLSGKQAEYIDEVVASGQHLLALVDDVLHLSRVEVGSDELSPGRVDLGALVARSTALFRDQAARKQVRVLTEVPSGLVVEGDERKLRQVVFNLVSNAVRFTPSGGTVQVRLVDDTGSVVLTVVDTGPGIDPSQHALVFEPFRQAPGGGQGGTGLGLSVARRFVELHGGTIEVTSVLGSGASFEVRLPAERRLASASPEVPAAGDGEDAALRSARAWLIRGLAASTALGGLLTSIGVAVLAPPAVGGSLLPTLLAFAWVGCIALELHRRHADRLDGPLTAHLLVASLFAAVTVGVATAGSLGQVAAAAYAWPALASVALLPRQWAIAHGAAAAAAFGVVLAAQPGFTTPGLRWVVIVAYSLLVAVTVGPLVAQVRDLARSEADARAEVERDSLATEAATRHKSEFVATMSHELRTPLNAIIGFSEALREEVFGPITELQAEYLDESLRAVRHLLALVNDVLELARLDAGRMPELRDEVVLPHLDDAVTVRLAQLESPIRAEVQVAGDPPPVLGDSSVLTRCLVELAAWVADRGTAPERSVRIVLVGSEGGAMITASTASAGRRSVSDAFEEFGGVAVQARRGTGLGMALARRQIERHGGWCRAEATPRLVVVTAWLPGVATPRSPWRPEVGPEGGRPDDPGEREGAEASRQHGPPSTPVA